MLVVCSGIYGGLSACGTNLSVGDDQVQLTGDGNSTTNSNTTTSGGNTSATPTPTPTMSPSPTPTPSPTCPTPANANDYFGSPRCCNTAAVLCEDFESDTAGGSPNSTLWTVAKATADTVEISTTQAARGSKSLHIHAINTNGQHAMITNSSAFPFANNMFWGRAFVYFNSAYPSNHTTYVAAGPKPNTNYEWLRYSSFGTGHLGGNDSDPDNSSNSSKQLTHAAWTCIEWQYDIPNLKAYYYFNGALISTLTINSHSSRPGDLDMQQIEIGWELYQQDSAVASGGAWDMYFDEIALDSKRIGCSN